MQYRYAVWNPATGGASGLLRLRSIPTPEEGVEKILSTPAGWHICRSACRGSCTPAGCNISALREGCSLETNWPIRKEGYSTRWGADPRESLSTNVPPRWVERISSHLLKFWVLKKREK